MKITLLFIIIPLLHACGNTDSDSNFRKELDKIKKEELPKQDVTMTSYAIDTIKNIKFISEIKSRLNRGQQSIQIITEYQKDNHKIAEVESENFRNTYFEGQKIIATEDGKYNLVYMIKNKKEEFRIFEVTLLEDTLKLSEVEVNHSTRLLFNSMDN